MKIMTKIGTTGEIPPEIAATVPVFRVSALRPGTGVRY
jgi:hypothetical protein